MSQKINFLDENDTYVNSKVNDFHDVMQTHKLTINTLVNLCGGIPLPEISQADAIVTSRSIDVVEIKLVSTYFEVTRYIDFGLKIINNIYMHVYENGKGIGTRLFCNQVKEARKNFFRIIYTTAMSPDGGDGWVGYYSWGRLGYKMSSEDNDEFLELAASFGKSSKNLWDLLKTEDGRIFWLSYGFTWSGEFLLHENSECLYQLKSYLREKGLRYEV